MAVLTLSFQGIRNLASARLNLSPGVNVFYGDNGAGKTSVLEAIHLLAMARSFKLARTRTVVSHELEELLVTGELGDGSRLGVRRTQKGQVQIRLNGESLASLAQLVHLMPVQLIHSDSFALLEGSPGDRRQFLDWGVFHQTVAFHEDWQRLQKSLKNRNSLLRSGRIERSQLAVWEREYIEAAERIDGYRKQYLEGFVPCFHDVLNQLVSLPELRIHYYRGWDRQKPLNEVLEQQRDRDMKLGYTQSGPQRADMRIKVNKVNAADELSRGQQKLVVCALKIAQSLYLQRQQNQPTVFLIDDLPAELDHHHIQRLGALMETLQSQVFMTCVDPAPLKTFWKHPDQVRMFHVEHGEIGSEMAFGDP
ncbi:DNA replication/repair protein RecF [Reinekea blandensis]|uniref:DNA replication and repair protein RecF n=1 Tax=Reinekea blandensis MED297 TaxID=314283 RepID=A4BD84_9GAMM|nr:DNA replication/repair protein RecF [Reinekea blandensis]EAR09828.1 recombination protein F [Reinekea sp. MED297] [Reinekea blandensis MED297]